MAVQTVCPLIVCGVINLVTVAVNHLCTVFAVFKLTSVGLEGCSLGGF